MDPMTMMALASVASSALGASGAGRSGGGQGTFPTQVIEQRTFGGTGQKFSTQNDFLMNQIAGMLGGQALPPVLQALLKKIQMGMSEQNQQNYFGTPGNRSGSIMDSARSTGAAMGVGPKATQAQTNKQLTNFGNAEKMIMDHISSLGMNAGSQWMGNILNASNQTPLGPPSQVVGGQPYQVPASNPWGDMGKALGTAAPWMSGAQWPGQNQVAQTTSPMDTFYNARPGSAASGGIGWMPSAPPANYQYSYQGYNSPTAYSADINPNRTINGETMAQRTAKYGGIYAA